MTKLIIVHPALIEKTYLQGRWQGRESHQPLSQDTLYIVVGYYNAHILLLPQP